MKTLSFCIKTQMVHRILCPINEGSTGTAITGGGGGGEG